MKAARGLWLVGGAVCLGGIAVSVQLREPAVAPEAADSEASTEHQDQARIVSSFSGFTGSEANARSLVAGLRQGGEVTLTAPGSGGQAGTSTRFAPPTRPMGYEDVRISLALARVQLGQLGISQPTPVQIKAALAGGAITNRAVATATPMLLPGVLQMRAHGMEWGSIAGTMGIKLGDAMTVYPAASPVPGARPAPTRLGSGAVPSALVRAEAPRQSRANGTLASGSSGPTVAGTATGVTRTEVPKRAESVKNRAPHSPASAAPDSTTARAATAGSRAAVATADPAPPGAAATLPQETRNPGPGVTAATEGAIAGATTAAPVQGPGNEPSAAPSGTRAEAPGTTRERGPKSTSATD